MGPIQSVSELISWLRRRWLVIITISILGAVGGVIAALTSERVYSATAVIQIITPVIEDEGATPAALSQRIQTIEQQMMSRESLLALAEEFDIFGDAPITQSDQVAILRESISIRGITAAQPGFTSDGSISALVITANTNDPQLAADISNELADRLVSQSAARRQQSARAALGFYQFEEDRLQTLIDEQDARIAEFQTANQDLLPGNQLSRREDLRRLEDSRLELERELVQLRSELATLDADSSRTVTRRRITALEDEVDQREEEIALLDERIDALRTELSRAPDIERELTAMERAITQLQDQLGATAESRREAELDLRIEDDQQSVRFELLEEALLPEYAISTGRKRIAMIWGMAGVMAGLGLAYALDWMNPVLRTARQMERELQLRPVISIPYTMSAAEVRRRRLMIVMASGMLILLGILAVLVVI
ncbi:MAG: putative protein involved in exopolysaccharide biosynthesis [Rhodobacteraceae bacterium HLUCCA12]|nr:MAG: putative protein involved in exopolysaccharide biosynthesis [Rhodobacteraceae bacterium HLUCCA12]